MDPKDMEINRLKNINTALMEALERAKYWVKKNDSPSARTAIQIIDDAIEKARTP